MADNAAVPEEPPAGWMRCVDCSALTREPAPYGMCPTCRSYETPLPPPFGDPWAEPY